MTMRGKPCDRTPKQRSPVCRNPKRYRSARSRTTTTGDDGLPIFTGVQTCKPGYQTPLHWHPYVECLFIIEGTMEAWLEGQEDSPAQLQVGDMIALPACVPHVFRNAGEGQLRLLGIHGSPTRIVHRIEE